MRDAGMEEKYVGRLYRLQLNPRIWGYCTLWSLRWTRRRLNFQVCCCAFFGGLSQEESSTWRQPGPSIDWDLYSSWTDDQVETWKIRAFKVQEWGTWKTCQLELVEFWSHRSCCRCHKNEICLRQCWWLKGCSLARWQMCRSFNRS